MKRPTAASLKKVTAENLSALGAERLAEILVAAANARPELKRRLRMELAAEQGAEALALEIDKRLSTIAGSRGRVSWRQRPGLVRELDALRALIVGRLAELDRATALQRLFDLLRLAPRLGGRMRDKDGSLAAMFERTAADLPTLVGEADADALAQAILTDLPGWSNWLEPLLASASPAVAAAALRSLAASSTPQAALLPLLRRLAEAAGDVDAYRATFTAAALKTPAGAADLAQRLLAAGRTEEAGHLLRGAEKPRGRNTEPDFAWEGAWIAYLEQAGRSDEAQALRWASFERTLSAERARDFTRRLADFDDVEAETRAFAYAAAHADAARGLQFLIDWPALAEAARMAQARAAELRVTAEQAEAWAAALRGRYPEAAELLLRSAASAAFRRGEFKTSRRLTEAADEIAP